MIVVAAAITAAIPPAAAQEWPTRPVSLVVPFAAGGPMDTIGRILASQMSDVVGQQVFVENVGGAGGMTGSARVAKAAPDGYQLVLGNFGTHAANQALYKSPLYNAAVDFTPVTLVAEVPFVLVVRKDFPAANLRDFIAQAKSNSSKLQFGSGGSGSATHIACALLNSAIGATITHIPYRGGGPAMQDLMAGRIDYQCLDLPAAFPQIESGSVRAIALLSSDRAPLLPALPTAREQGLADFGVTNWSALFLPPGTPGNTVDKVRRAALAALNTPTVRDRLKDVGATVVAADRQGPQYLASFLASEIERWAALIKRSGLSAE